MQTDIFFLNMKNGATGTDSYNYIYQKQKTTNDFSFIFQMEDKGNVRILINIWEQNTKLLFSTEVTDRINPTGFALYINCSRVLCVNFLQ